MVLMLIINPTTLTNEDLLYVKVFRLFTSFWLNVMIFRAFIIMDSWLVSADLVSMGAVGIYCQPGRPVSPNSEVPHFESHFCYFTEKVAP